MARLLAGAVLGCAVISAGCTADNPLFGESEGSTGNATGTGTSTATSTTRASTTGTASTPGPSTADPTRPSTSPQPSGTSVGDSSGTRGSASYSGSGGTAGQVCAMDECDPLEDDCGNGFHCGAFAKPGEDLWTGWACVVDPEPSVGFGGACTSDCSGAGVVNDNCGTGLACLTGLCQFPCGNDVRCGPVLVQCSVAFHGEEIGLCEAVLPACDPFGGGAPSDCENLTGGDTEVCTLLGAGTPTAELGCTPEAIVELGVSCDNETLFCAAGHVCAPNEFVAGCLDGAALACCTLFCERDADCTVNGESCVSLYAPFEPPMNQTNIGYCRIPPS